MLSMKKTPYIALTLFLATFFVFFPVQKNAFVDFDDPEYITANPHVATGLSWENVLWAVKKSHAHNWHPLTWLSHMVDVELFGLNPRGHHLMGAFLHAINASLAFLLFFRLTGEAIPAAFIAAFFALHPLRVESVAWAAERKDVLSVFFFLTSLLAYEGYVRKGRASLLLASIGLHALGLTAKQMGVSLPFILLLLDYWPFRRLSLQGPWRRVLWEKVPFFLLSFGAGLTVYLVQQATGVLHGGEVFPLSVRMANALYSATAYLSKIVWPTNLAVFYPHPLNTLPPSYVLFCALFLLTLTAGVFGSRRPYLVTGWLWYLITLLPVCGLIQVGIQGMADRYTYLPSLGIFLMVTLMARDLTKKWPPLKGVFVSLGLLALTAFSVLTVKQIGVWQNPRTLYAHAVKVTKDNYWAYNNLGAALFAEGRKAEAKEMFEQALAILPEYPGANKNLAALLLEEGKYEAALRHIKRALSVQPRNPEYWTAKGAILLRMGDRQGATEAFRAALEVSPGYPDAKEGLREAGEKP